MHQPTMVETIERGSCNRLELRCITTPLHITVTSPASAKCGIYLCHLSLICWRLPGRINIVEQEITIGNPTRGTVHVGK
jgi:hypothetical protein